MIQVPHTISGCVHVIASERPGAPPSDQGHGTPGSHAIEKLCAQLNDFASRSKALKGKRLKRLKK